MDACRDSEHEVRGLKRGREGKRRGDLAVVALFFGSQHSLHNIIRRIQPIVSLATQGETTDVREEITQNRPCGAPAPFDTHGFALMAAQLDLRNLDFVLHWMQNQGRDRRPCININPAGLLNGHGEELLERLDRVDHHLLKRLTIEVTEHTAGILHGGSLRQIVERLDGIKTRGVRLSLDDLGANENGLNRLLWGVWDEIKLDGSIGRQLGATPAADAYCRHIRRISESMGLEMVIEHLETEDQVKIARDIGADFGQGHAFGRPQDLLVESSTTQS